MGLKKNNPSLSKTTVYNSLEILNKHDIIHTISITGFETRYDIENKIHHHFLCKQCGRIIDIDIACPNIKKTLEYGHRIEEVHGYFKGKCKECLDKEIDKYGS